MKNKLFFIPLFMFIAVAVTLVTSNPASAATQWDTVLNTIDPNQPQICNLYASSPDCQTLTATGITNAINTYCGGTDSAMFDYVLNGGGNYAIYHAEAYKPPIVGTDFLRVIYTADEIDTTIVTGLSGSYYDFRLNVTQGNTYVFELQRSTNTYSGSCRSANPTETVAQQYRDRNQSYCQVPVWTVTNACNIYYLISSTYDITYPSGYEGRIVPGTAYPVAHSEETPDIVINSGESYVFSANDNNFNTFDPVPFTCSDELAPVWNYEIWDGQDPATDTLFTSGTLSATGTLTLTLEPNKQWTIVSYYSCAEEPIFDNSSFDYFDTGEIAYSDQKPNWYISNIMDFKAKFHDTNFNTFDGNPFLCSEDLAPVLHYEIWRKSTTDVLLSSGTQSATAEINYDFGQAEIDRDYQILGWYDCGDTDPLQFNQNGTLDFTINKSGTQVVDLFTNCVMPEFPFVNVPGCVDNMFTIINLLAFGEIKFPSFTFNPACQNLNTMDEWLNLPNGYQVCPQIPASVRNVVTPFVAFMLGLVTLKFIQRRSGDFNG